MYYLKLSRIFTLTCLLLILVGSTMNAQIISSACNFPIVATQCVGSCGSPSEINYTGPAICSALVKNYCVVNESSSLCPDHNAIVTVFVNGLYVTSGNITTVGSGLAFQAKCGSSIKVIASTYFVGGGISCIWLGDLNYSLREQ